MRHPQVGELFLRREKLDIAGTDGLQMVIYHAEPGTESGQALALLGSIAATAERDAAERDTAIRAVAEQAAPPAGTYNPEKESS
jgi:MmyB-like transcription regulator ligand binding domain